MEPGAAIFHLQTAFWMILWTAGPILAVALAVGLAIGVVQAATSISESTLSFVPKLVVVLLTMALVSSYMLQTVGDYFGFIFETIRVIR